MILGYRKAIGSDPPYWWGKQDGQDLKFVRVVAGVALPIQDRVSGAAIILGEQYRQVMPPNLIGLGAAVGQWGEIENDLAQFRRDLKFDHAIVDVEPARKILYRMKGMNFGQSEYPLITYVAPEYSLTEIGRNYTNGLIKERRLSIAHLKSFLDREPDQSILALNMACCWLRDWPAIYQGARRPVQRGQILGIEGL